MTAFASLAASPAFAAAFTFNLTQTNSSTDFGAYTQTFSSTTGSTQNSVSNVGNVFDYTTKNDSTGQTLSMQVTGWSIDKQGSSTPNHINGNVYDARLRVWNGNGIGIQNQWESDGVPQHSIDNEAGIDFVILQFNQKVDLNSVSIGWVYTDDYGNEGPVDADFSIKWGDPTSLAWDAIPVIDEQAESVLNNLLSNPNAPYTVDNSSTGTIPIHTNVMSDFWIISAASPNPNNDGKYKNKTYLDYIKLQKLIVSTDIPPVPEPSTWMFMITGFGAIGAMMRRRRRDVPANDRAIATA